MDENEIRKEKETLTRELEIIQSEKELYELREKVAIEKSKNKKTFIKKIKKKLQAINDRFN